MIFFIILEWSPDMRSASFHSRVRVVRLASTSTSEQKREGSVTAHANVNWAGSKTFGNRWCGENRVEQRLEERERERERGVCQ